MTSFVLEYRGELAALLAAFFWAIASAIYARAGARVPVLELNVLKGTIAVVLLGLTVLVRGQALPDLPLQPAIFLLLSGVVGIGLGDTAFFAALNTLGARRTLLFETLAPVLTAFLAALTLAERLPAAAWGAIVLTLVGIGLAIAERTSGTDGSSPQDVRAGLTWATLAAIAQAIGVILSRAALRDSEILPLWSALLRLVAGTLCAVLLLQGRRQPLTVWARRPDRWRILGAVALASLLGTYGGIWLQQAALKFAPAGIVQTLSATSPIVALPLAVLAGERLGWRAIAGATIACAGIAWLFLNA